MDLRFDLPTYVGDTNLINVVVEIPKGSRNKYEIDETTGDRVTVVRQMNKGFLGFRDYKYIFNYGFICNTAAPDGDQLDAIIISDESIDTLTVLKCKVVAVIRTIDNGEVDDKVFNLNKILRFLKNYKYPNQDKTTVGKVLDAESAHEIIASCRYYMKQSCVGGKDE